MQLERVDPMIVRVDFSLSYVGKVYFPEIDFSMVGASCQIAPRID